MLPNSYATRPDLLQEQQKFKTTFTPNGSSDYMTTGGSFLVTEGLPTSTSSTQFSNSTHPVSLSLPPPPPPPPPPLTPLPTLTAPNNLARGVSPTLSSSYDAQYHQSTPTPPETLAPLASLNTIPHSNSNIGHSFQSISNTNGDLQHHPLYHDPPIPSLPPPPPATATANKQKCTRCKRWRTIDQFQNDDSALPPHAGCLECRESARKYGQSEYGKATRRNYNQTEKAKETRKKYAQSEKGRESRKKYAQTDKAKEVRRKYNRSEKAKETRKRRALIQSERQQEQGGGKIMDANGTFDLVPGFMENLDFGDSQESNDNICKMKSMEKASLQTAPKTMYDRVKEPTDEQDDLQADIRPKYMRGK